MGFVEDEVKQLKDVLGALDLRIKKLEQRALGTSPTTDEIRMILIGPPGAGTSFFLFSLSGNSLAAYRSLLRFTVLTMLRL